MDSILKGFRAMDDKERFALAERIQKKVQDEHHNSKLIKRRDKLEKKLRIKEVESRS
jgi:hypothetical protein